MAAVQIVAPARPATTSSSQGAAPAVPSCAAQTAPAVAQHLLTRHLSYSGTRLGPTLLRSAAVTAATAGAVWAAQLGTAGAAPWLELVVASLAGATTWTAAIVMVGHPLRVELYRLIGYARGRSLRAAS